MRSLSFFRSLISFLVDKFSEMWYICVKDVGVR